MILKTILMSLAISVQANTYVVVRNYNNNVPVKSRPRRATRSTIMARNTFTLQALQWSKRNGGWTHKIYNVSGANRHWNMTNLRPNLMRAFTPSTWRSGKYWSRPRASKTYHVYVPAYREQQAGETNCPSYYMMGGAGYKTRRIEK